MLLFQSFPSDEVDILVQLCPESSTAFERRDVRVQILAPECVELFDSQSSSGIVPALLQVEFLEPIT